MLRRNKWSGDKVNLVLPPLPPEYRGQSSAVFQAFCFDPQIGDEVALFLLDDPEFSRQVGKLRPIKLFATTGVVRTSAGMIAFVVWSIDGPRGHVVDYEQPLNPFNIDTIRMLSALGQQSHLKVVPIDSLSNEAVGFFEFENVYGFDHFAGGIAQVIGHEPVADFAATQAALRVEFTLEELKIASEL